MSLGIYKMDRIDMKTLLLETIQEEAPLLLAETRRREGRAGVDALIEMQIEAAMEMQEQLCKAKTWQQNPSGMRELVTERLLDYPGKPMNYQDPFIIDRDSIFDP